MLEGPGKETTPTSTDKPVGKTTSTSPCKQGKTTPTSPNKRVKQTTPTSPKKTVGKTTSTSSNKQGKQLQLHPINSGKEATPTSSNKHRERDNSNFTKYTQGKEQLKLQINKRNKHLQLLLINRRKKKGGGFRFTGETNDIPKFT